MTTYKEIYGTNVEVLSSDPTNPVTGQIWYNSTSQTLKGYALVAGSWATAGPLNTARYTLGNAGTQTAALAFGGLTTPPTTITLVTESWNGTSWTTNPASLNTSRGYIGSCGATNTAALAFGGAAVPGIPQVGDTETWNGTSWTEVNNMNTARYDVGGFGTNTAAIAASGYSTAPVTNVESWNGTSWTEVNDVNTARYGIGTAGIQTAGLIFGGFGGGTATESWNGTNWTIVNPLNTSSNERAGAGTQTSALGFGGNPQNTNEAWNGTAWTSLNSLNVPRSNLAGVGTSNTAALAFGGSQPPQIASTELWSGPAVRTVNITVS
jgi:hypothetical protein